MTAAPVRLRLSRAKGFDLHAHSRAVNGLEAELADYRKYYSIGDMKLVVSPDLHERDKEEK